MMIACPAVFLSPVFQRAIIEERERSLQVRPEPQGQLAPPVRLLRSRVPPARQALGQALRREPPGLRQAQQQVLPASRLVPRRASRLAPRLARWPTEPSSRPR